MMSTMDWDDDLKEQELTPEEMEARRKRSEAAREWLEANMKYKPYCSEW